MPEKRIRASSPDDFREPPGEATQDSTKIARADEPFFITVHAGVGYHAPSTHDKVERGALNRDGLDRSGKVL